MVLTKQIMLAKLVKKIVISVSLHIFPWARKRVFLWLFTDIFFQVGLVDEDLDIFHGIGFLDEFIDEISSLLVNNFCKLGIVWVSMIPLPQNISIWYQFTLRNVSLVWLFMFFFSEQVFNFLSVTNRGSWGG